MWCEQAPPSRNSDFARALGVLDLAERYRPVATLLPRPCSLGHLCPCVYSLYLNYPSMVLGGGRFPCDGRRASPATAGVGEGGGSGSGSGSMTPGTAGAGGGRPVAAPVTPTFTVGGASKARPVVLLPSPWAVWGWGGVSIVPNPSLWQAVTNCSWVLVVAPHSASCPTAGAPHAPGVPSGVWHIKFKEGDV